MSDQRIPISQLSETQTAPDASYIAIDDGSLTKKITVENFNSTSTASAQQYANQAAASAQTVEDNIATSAAQIREATLAAREATQASTAASASATSAYDSASLAQNYSANASTSAGQAMNAADSAAQNLTASKRYAEDSEAWAVGKRNGTDVPSSDDTYHNNAKYYSDNATTAATSAASDADRAEAAAESINVPDTTLTVSGVAAESKATGDRISSVNAELVDIRVKADGTTASTAGNAVREQFTKLKNDLDENVSDLKSSLTLLESEYTTYSNNLWVNFYGTYNGVTFAPNGKGGTKITGTASATGLFSYNFDEALSFNGMRLQYDQKGITQSGQLYIYCRNASNVVQRELQITSEHGVSVDSSARSIKTLQWVVISGVTYDCEIYVSLTEGVSDVPIIPKKLWNAYTAKTAETAESLGNPNIDIAFWGDSLTQGVGGDGTTFCKVCANILGASFINGGSGGETANTISARQGGNAWIMPAGAVNGQYDLAAMNDVFGGKVTPLRQYAGDPTGTKIIVNGKECNFVRTSQTSPTSDNIIYTVSGYTGAALTVAAPVRFIGSDVEPKVTVIFVGTNGQTVGEETDVNARITIIDSMISHLKNKNYIVMGLSNGNTKSRSADDAAMLKHYGNNFFPTRMELVKNGLAIQGITPTANDLVYIESGTVPESLRIDATHLNAQGYTALGKLLAYKMYSLGYDTLF